MCSVACFVACQEAARAFVPFSHLRSSKLGLVHPALHNVTEAGCPFAPIVDTYSASATPRKTQGLLATSRLAQIHLVEVVVDFRRQERLVEGHPHQLSTGVP